MKKQRRQFPGASSYKDRHGRRRWRYRVKGFQAELGAVAYGSEEFRAAYAAAVAAREAREGAGASRTRPGSFSALIASYYRSPSWRNLAASTQRCYRGVIEELRERHGENLVAPMEPRHVAALMAKKADHPFAANNMRKRLMALLDHAITLGWIKANPARAARPYRARSEGFHTWTETEIAAFLAHYGPGTLARRAMLLMLCTGAARVDACALGWQHVKDGRLQYRRRKTLRSGGVLIDIPILPELRVELETCSTTSMTFLETAEGKARSPDGLGRIMREWCDAAGLPECSTHGLRKACARRLAEFGATPNEIAAVTGHRSLGEITRYTAAADRRGLADRAMAKVYGPNAEQNSANPGESSPNVLSIPLK